MFLPLPAHPGSPRQIPQSRKAVVCVVCVTENISNENMLYVPTSPNLCFCTIWQHRKPINCIFSLVYCSLLCQ